MSSSSALLELNDTHLLNIILAPDLEESLSHEALLAVNNQTIFRLLPLILAAVHRIGESPSHRQNYVKLVTVLRMRVAACRGIKLRFLILVRGPAFCHQWKVKLVHRRHCYHAAKHALDNYMSEAQNERDSDALPRAASASFRHAVSKQVSDYLNDKRTLISFAAQSLLHPEHGIRTRTLNWSVIPVHDAFYASELVDGIMERANFKSREDAVQVAQKIQDYGLIADFGGLSSKFKDSDKKLYRSHLKLHRDDAGHCRVKTKAGDMYSTWYEIEDKPTPIKQIELQLSMDLIDFQTFDFWTRSIYTEEEVGKGYRFPAVGITHPMYYQGLNALAHLDLPKTAEGGEPTTDPSQQGGSATPTDIEGETPFPSPASSSTETDLHQTNALVGSVVVRKVFASLTRPMIVQLCVPLEDADWERDEHMVLPPDLLVKNGDNLMRDMAVEMTFHVFNHIWASSPLINSRYTKPPYSHCFEVFPTATGRGFMETMTGLVSLKEFDWKKWRKSFESDPDRVEDMLRSAAGSYIGTYVTGGRDRHFDNIVVKDDTHVVHLDFGFTMGISPPIDCPPIAIAPDMESTFQGMKIWGRFLNVCVDAFLALRAEAPTIIRTMVMIFSKAGYEEEQIRNFVQGKSSLNVRESDEKAGHYLRRQLVSSSGDLQARFKAFVHDDLNPAWYSLLEKGFPPAKAIMKLVDASQQKAAEKMQEKDAPTVNEDEKIHL